MKTETEQIIEHLTRHGQYAKLVISRSYPFNVDELRMYTEILDWECVSMNSNIYWTHSIFNEFEYKIDIEGLSYCDKFPWTEDFIDKHVTELFYNVMTEGKSEKSCFALNCGLPWSERFINKYAEHWDWLFLSMNEHIPFTIELLNKYSDKWDYETLEFNNRIINDESLKSYLNIFYNRDVREFYHKCEFCYKGEEILEEYKGKTYSTEFCTCPNFNWSEKFATKLKKILKSNEAGKMIARDIRWGTFKHWSIDVLDAFEEFWDYDTLYLAEELNDKLAFGLQKSGRLDEVIRVL